MWETAAAEVKEKKRFEKVRLKGGEGRDPKIPNERQEKGIFAEWSKEKGCFCCRPKGRKEGERKKKEKVARYCCCPTHAYYYCT